MVSTVKGAAAVGPSPPQLSLEFMFRIKYHSSVLMNIINRFNCSAVNGSGLRLNAVPKIDGSDTIY